MLRIAIIEEQKAIGRNLDKAGIGRGLPMILIVPKSDAIAVIGCPLVMMGNDVHVLPTRSRTFGFIRLRFLWELDYVVACSRSSI